MENVALMDRVVGEVTRLLDGVQDSQLGDATPCTDWTVKDLLAHLVGGAAMFADAFAGRESDMSAPPALPDDVAKIRELWAANCASVMGEFKADVPPDEMVQMPWGPMPRGAAIDLATFDVTTHACDLATATGQQAPSDDLTESALAMGKQMIGPEMRVPGFFGDEQTPPDGADAAMRLLAFAGRAV